MPKFLNHLDLNGNQLKNTKLEITDSPLAEEGVIHYHDTNNTIRYHNGVGFITLGDNDVATTSAAGVAKLRYSVGATPTAEGQSVTANRTYGVTANSSDQLVVNVPWVDTTVANTDTFRTVAVDTNGDGSVNNTLTTTEDLVLKKGTNITLSETDGVITISSTDTNTQLSTTGVTGMALTGMVTTATTAVAATDSILVAMGKLEARTALNDAKVTNSQVSTDVTLGTVTSNYLSLSGQEITAGTVPVALGGTGATDASTARTNLDVDQSGTDNSTPVTLVTTSHDYLTLSSQAITLAAIDLTTDVTGDLPIAEGGTGQSSAAAAADALLNTDQGGTLSIGVSTDTITIAGDLVVTGAQTTTLSNTVQTGDNFIELATGNTTANATDFGWYGKFFDSTLGYAGMHWDASATRFKLGYGDDVPPAGTHDWDNAGHLEVGKLTTTDLVIGGHTISDLDITSETSNADDHLMTSAAITALIADNANSFSTATGVENNADVTDATNVAAAGAVMDGDFSGTTGLLKKDSAGVYSLDTSAYSTATGVANNADVTPSWVPANDPSYLTSAPNTMGSGFTVSATTDTTATTITEGDDLFFADGTGINCVTTADGTVTITNTAPNVTQTTITGNAGSATVLEDGAVGGVKVFDLIHDGSTVVNENTSNSTDSAEWTITHGMGNSFYYKAEVVLDSGNYDTVYVDVQRPTNATVKVTFGSDVVNGAYAVMLTRMA